MAASHAPATLTVVVPVGPDDRLGARLRAQLGALSSQSLVRVVHAPEVDGHEVIDPATKCSTRRSALGRDQCHPGKPKSRPGALLHEGGPQWHVLRAARGRAAQQNAGARDAPGAWLWFLHADSVLAPDTLPALARFIASDADALGYFDLRFLDDGPALTQLNAFGARLRSRWLRLPFGDQGFVLRRETFEKLGGFDIELAGGEDHDLVWRARRAGVPLRALGAPLYTSARKYAERGWWATTRWHLQETWRQARRFSRPERV